MKKHVRRSLTQHWPKNGERELQGELFAQNLSDRVKDRFHCLHTLLPLNCVLDYTINGPHLLKNLGLYNSCQHLVSGRGEILHENKFLVLASWFREILLLFHDGDLDGPRGHLDDNLRWTS